MSQWSSEPYGYWVADISCNSAILGDVSDLFCQLGERGLAFVRRALALIEPGFALAELSLAPVGPGLVPARE